MLMNPYLAAILILLALDYLLEMLSDKLNLGHMTEQVPEELRDCYDADRHARSQRYLLTNTRFDMLRNSIATPLTVLFILLGGFALVDRFVRAAGLGMIGTGLLFAGTLTLLAQCLDLPFSLYSTFGIEERFGFNRTTPATFVLDRLKGLGLLIVIGGPLFAVVLWFFDSAGPHAWLYAWALLTAVQLVMTVVAPVLLLPLFNKFEPLEEGELRHGIAEYAREQGFLLRGIFKIDGSRRSSKSNAYFTGLGRWKRIALFDTLIEKHSVPELLAVLAHEIGHYKLGHIWKYMLISVATNGLLFFLLSLFIERPGLYEAFGLHYEPIQGSYPIYAGFVFFGFLFAPVQRLLAIGGNCLSRHYEFAADAFAARTTGTPEAFIKALKRLSVDNLSNPTPHPFAVFLHYSHPPVLERIRALGQPET